jgi:cell wall-associated NlpC family hydrolase
MLVQPTRLTTPVRPAAAPAPAQALEAVRRDAAALQAAPAGHAVSAASADPVGGAPSLWATLSSKANSVGRHLLGTTLGVVGWGADRLKGLFARKEVSEPTGGGGVATVRRGSNGASVRTLQERLRAHGFNPGPIDGDFGPKTDAAVRAFQRAKGLVVDGIVGPKTWGALGGVHHAPAPAPAPSPGGNSQAQRFVDQAKRFLGQRYVWGGGHASSTRVGVVDCSGLVLQAARLAGFNLDGTAATQQRRGHAVSMNALRPGDLLFHGRPASHVGIYIGNGQAIHASSTQGKVVIVNLSSYRYFDSARRVL